MVLVLDLQSPILSDVTVNEGEMLKLQCASSNIPNLITFHILGPNGMPVSVGFFYSVPNVTRAHAGTYTCVVMGTLDNTTVTLNATSTVVVQCKL